MRLPANEEVYNMHEFNVSTNAEVDVVSLKDDHALFVESFNKGAVCFLDGLSFMVPSGIYKPGPGSSTEFIWESIKKYMNSIITERDRAIPQKILEIGAGSGAISILIKNNYPSIDVVSTDISEKACTTIECNALLNGVRLKILCGDLWEPLKTSKHEQYDGIIFNMPLMNKEVENEHELSLCDLSGRILHQFLSGLTDYVKPEGFALFLHASFSAPINNAPGRMQTIMKTTRSENNVLQSILWKNK